MSSVEMNRFCYHAHVDSEDNLRLAYADANTIFPAAHARRDRRLSFKRWMVAFVLWTPIATALIATGNTYAFIGFAMFSVLAIAIFSVEWLRRKQGTWLIASILLAILVTFLLQICSSQTIIIENQSDEAVQSMSIMFSHRAYSMTLYALPEHTSVSNNFHDLTFDGVMNVSGDFVDSVKMGFAHSPFQGAYRRTTKITIKPDRSVDITWP